MLFAEVFVDQIGAVDRRKDRSFGIHGPQGQQHSLGSPHLIEPVMDERNFQVRMRGALMFRPSSQYAPSPRITAGTVRARILRSSPSDQWPM